jgi:hypothetical protein
MKIKLVGKNAHQGLERGDATSLASVAVLFGHQIIDGSADFPDVVICVDYTKESQSEINLWRKQGVPTVLVQQEPYVVLPEHRKLNPGGSFDLVFKIGIPGEVTRPYANSWNLGKDWTSIRIPKFVAITANKWSAIPGQLYSLRRSAYRLGSEVDLFGVAWDKPFISHLTMLMKEILLAVRGGVWPQKPDWIDIFGRPANCLGPVTDKLATLEKYDYSLVIENSGHYMSEKLMDSLLAGNLPVYVGAPASKFGIPSEFVFQAEPNIQSIREQMELAKKTQITVFRADLLDWLTEPSRLEYWRADFANKRLLDEITEKTQKNF